MDETWILTELGHNSSCKWSKKHRQNGLNDHGLQNPCNAAIVMKNATGHLKLEKFDFNFLQALEKHWQTQLMPQKSFHSDWWLL